MSQPEGTTPGGWARVNPRTALASAAVAMMIGSICPWATFLGLISASGLAVRFGWVTLLGGATLLWLTRRAGRSRRRRRLALTVATLGALSCVLVILGLSGGEDGGTLHTSWGVYLTLLACVAAGWNARKVLS